MSTQPNPADEAVAARYNRLLQSSFFGQFPNLCLQLAVMDEEERSLFDAYLEKKNKEGVNLMDWSEADFLEVASNVREEVLDREVERICAEIRHRKHQAYLDTLPPPPPPPKPKRQRVRLKLTEQEQLQAACCERERQKQLAWAASVESDTQSGLTPRENGAEAGSAASRHVTPGEKDASARASETAERNEAGSGIPSRFFDGLILVDGTTGRPYNRSWQR